MKKFFRFLLSLVFVLFSCKSRSVPVTKITRNESENLNFRQINDEKTSDLQIYFPLFTDSNGEFVEGDGIVIIFPNKQVMVVDGFYPEASESFVHFLKNDLQITQIDYLVATHFHKDHIGSFPAIFDNFIVKNFWSNGAPIDTDFSNKFVQKVLDSNIKETIVTKGDIIKIDDVELKILWPSLTEEEIYKVYYEPGKTAKRINLSSIVMKLSYKDFSILFTGDIYKKGEKELVDEYGKELKSTVLKVPHHGDYYTSNSREFLKAISPMYAIAQTPKDFPLITKLRYKYLDIPLFRVSKSGYLKILVNEKDYSIVEVSN